jgi:hypothetical protein
MAIARLFLVLLSFSLLTLGGKDAVCFGGAISSTADQNGFNFLLGQTGAVSKIGTFEFSGPADSYSQVRLRDWIEMSPNSVGANAPILVFAKYNVFFPDYSIIFGPVVTTNLSVENVNPVSNGIEDRQSAWVNLTPSQGNALRSIVASDPLGRVDAWLYSPTNRDFSTPDVDVSTELTPDGELIETTFVFTATVELVPLIVPEPSSYLVATGLSFVFFRFRRRSRRVPEEGVHDAS